MWSNHDVAVKYYELTGSLVSYQTLLKHYESLSKSNTLKKQPQSSVYLAPVPTLNSFNTLNDQADIVEIDSSVANPSKL